MVGGNTNASSPSQTSRADLTAFLGVALVAFVLRLIHVLQSRAVVFFDLPVVDARGYLEWAQRIADGDWLGTGVFYQAPLYPYFLAVVRLLVGSDLLWLRIVQAGLGAVSCGVLYLAGKTFFSRSAGLAAGLILALYPPAIFFDTLIQKSVLDLLCTVFLLWLIGRAQQKPRHAVLSGAGAVLGLLSLTRENALLLGPVLLVWIAVRSRAGGPAELGGPPLQGRGRDSIAQQHCALKVYHAPRSKDVSHPTARRAAGFVAGLLLILLPVGVRNLVIGGEFTLTTSQAGPNFYIGNHPDAPGVYVPLRPGRGGPRTERQDATELAEAAVGRRLTPGEVSRFWFGQSWRFIRQQPVEWLHLLGRKCRFTFNAYEIPDAEDMYFYARSCGLIRGLGVASHFGVLLPLAAAGVVLTGRHWRELWILYALVLTIAAGVIAFYVFARYRFPMVPVLVLFAAAAIVEGFAAVRSRQAGRLGAAIAALMVAAVAANWPLAFPKESQIAVSHTNAGDALYDQAQFGRALAEYAAAVRIEPRIMEAHLGLAKTLGRLGRISEARAAYRQARQREPEAVEIEIEFGKALAEAGQHTAAVEHLRRALSLLPKDSDLARDVRRRLRACEQQADRHLPP